MYPTLVRLKKKQIFVFSFLVIESAKVADEPAAAAAAVVDESAAAVAVYSREEEGEEVLQLIHRAGVPAAAEEEDDEMTTTQEIETTEMMADEEKPIVALEKERVCLQVVEDEYQHIRHHHQQQLTSLSDLVSRHSIDSLDQECGHTAEDPDDGNYPGSCLSAEDSGIHTEDMSSCVSQADDEERSNLQPSPVLLQQQPSNAVQQHVDDDAYNMV